MKSELRMNSATPEVVNELRMCKKPEFMEWPMRN